MPSSPASDRQLEAVRELINAAAQNVEAVRRCIALLSLDCDQRTVEAVEGLYERASRLFSTVQGAFAGEPFDEPLTPQPYRYAAGR